MKKLTKRSDNKFSRVEMFTEIAKDCGKNQIDDRCNQKGGSYFDKQSEQDVVDRISQQNQKKS